MSTLPTSAELPEVEPFLDRLERQVLQLLNRRFKSARALWRLQLRLLTLQRDIQSAIGIAKRVKTPEGRARAAELRNALWHARRFGDAIAWVMFRGERRLIDSLSWNAAVPVPPADANYAGQVRGVEGLAERLGLPLLHDITDILRVGDVTFFGADDGPHTVEIKTTILSSERRGSQTVMQVQGTAIWPARRRPPGSAPPDNPPAADRRFNARVRRQLDRLTRAADTRDAVPGSPTVVAGTPTLILESTGKRERTDHWPTLRRMIRRARRSGYASAATDSGTMYVAMYSPTGFDALEQFLGSVPEDILASGILLKDTTLNSLWILPMPDPRRTGPDRFLPYFLLPIPRPWIVDILRGRLVLMAIFNPGVLRHALHRIGLRTADPKANTFLKVFIDVESDAGNYLVEVPSLNENVVEMVMEAQGLDRVLDAAEAMAQGLRDQLPAMIRQEQARRATEGEPLTGRHRN